MENCLDEWLKYIDDKREEYQLLNHFTIDQMVILQRELVKAKVDSEPSNLIYPLLSSVKRDCTKSDLITAMRQAKADVDKMEVSEQEVDMAEEEVEPCVDEMEDDGKNVDVFIAEMVKAGYNEKLAKAALNHIDPDEVDEGGLKCSMLLISCFDFWPY